jgi:diguanylate cyclase (GGDEF)-like protein
MIDFKMVYRYSKDLNVLYVEDNQEVRESTADILESYFSTLDVAIDGLDGLEKYKAYHANNAHYYDLVISDIQMPNLNGIELSKSILEINDDQMIIIFSAYSEPMYLFELINLGISSFLNKPIEINHLNKTLYRISRNILNKKAEIERYQHEKEEKAFLQSVMDLQDNLIVITDGKDIKSVNQTMLNFFNSESLDIFKNTHNCICYAFLPIDGYFHQGVLTSDTLWVEHILNYNDQNFMVMMQNEKTLERESFKVSINYFRSKKQYIVTFSNITKIALKNKRDQHKASYDNLTGIYNRHKLNDLLQEYFSPEIKINTDHLTFILFDIDNFKEINDTYGHLVGDKVLKQLIAIIKENTRRSDIFARWGGDEFILVIDNITLEKAIKATEYLRQTIAESIFGTVGHITCSFGISSYQEGDTINKMMRRVDQAMYNAKKSGRNKTCYI